MSRYSHILCKLCNKDPYDTVHIASKILHYAFTSLFKHPDFREWAAVTILQWHHKDVKFKTFIYIYKFLIPSCLEIVWFYSMQILQLFQIAACFWMSSILLLDIPFHGIFYYTILISLSLSKKMNKTVIITWITDGKQKFWTLTWKKDLPYHEIEMLPKIKLSIYLCQEMTETWSHSLLNSATVRNFQSTYRRDIVKIQYWNPYFKTFQVKKI